MRYLYQNVCRALYDGFENTYKLRKLANIAKNFALCTIWQAEKFVLVLFTAHAQHIDANPEKFNDQRTTFREG